MENIDRPSPLELVVPDSGRTWSILHHEIQQVPPDRFELGDVLIVRHATETGVMFMQIAARIPGEGWELAELKLRK